MAVLVLVGLINIRALLIRMGFWDPVLLVLVGFRDYKGFRGLGVSGLNK